MSMLSNTDYADCFTNGSGTEEEENLLAAHLGIFDSHVQVYTDHMDTVAYEEWCAKMDSERNEFPAGEFPFDPPRYRKSATYGDLMASAYDEYQHQHNTFVDEDIPF